MWGAITRAGGRVADLAHLEAGLALAEGHRVAWAAGAHAATLAAGQQEQAADQQQGEGQVAQQVKEDRTAVLSVGVGGKVDVLVPADRVGGCGGGREGGQLCKRSAAGNSTKLRLSRNVQCTRSL
jgi:hypothetical protein